MQVKLGSTTGTSHGLKTLPLEIFICVAKINTVDGTTLFFTELPILCTLNYLESCYTVPTY
ncbi:MAG: hypothetical protein NT027_17195 [Proteobacteria bacterium]|nr:hypothetical protein [Pseudomonadota bacterium]